MVREVVEQHSWVEMYVNIEDRLKTSKPFQKRVRLPYEEPLKKQTVSRQWQQVRMDILYMPKTEDGHRLLMVA